MGTPDTWIDLLRRLAPLLPTDLFARLRACSAPTGLSTEEQQALAGDLQGAIAALDSLRHTLTTFMPHYLLDLAPTPGQPLGELLEGSFIFADVTGFTALSGELSRRGTEGREEMNRLMSALFAALLDPLLTSGGDLLMFAGDAVLAYFPSQPEGQDARWAIRAALRLVKAIAPFVQTQTPYGTFSLTMSAGVERGRAFTAIVGTRQRMEQLITGGPVQGAMRAEGAAKPGQVSVGPGILPFVHQDQFNLQGNIVAGIRVGELDDFEAVPPARRRRRLSAVFSHRIPDLIEHLQYALGQVEAIVPFISSDLFNQIAGGEDFRQHPPVAVQFVNLLGIEDLALGPAGPEQAIAVLQRYFVHAHEIVADREGIINKIDPYAKGLFLLNPFGALTHREGGPRLAASAALELAHALEQVNREYHLDPPLVQRIGLTYDRIFTGELGYRHRREYVVAGPAVNLAARLMGKADPGQIVLDPVAWDAVQEDFRAEALPPVPLKGIAEAVPRFSLRGLRKGKGLHLTDYPLVGQREEQARLKIKMAKAITGHGGGVALVGEAGAGKSRLVAAMAAEAHQRGMAVLIGRCPPFAQSAPYFPWTSLILEWFELDDEMSAEARRQRMRESLAELNLAPSFPAFASLVGLPPIHLASHTGRAPAHQGSGLFASLKQQSERTRTGAPDLATLLSERTASAESPGEGSITPDDRPSIWEILRERASIPQALHLLLEHQALRQPTLVIIEDLQWMDPASREVLDGVVATAPAWPLFLLVTARPETDWGGEVLPISPLSSTEGEELAAFALRATRLEPDLAAWLDARASGQPLFILSYCQALRDADAVVVDPANSEARWNGPSPMLPLSLQELLLAQVDRLGQEGRDVMRRAAVIGVNFSTWLLARLCCGAPILAQQMNEALDRAARRSIIAPPPPALDFNFSSQSLQDAIYVNLSHALRRDWHEQAGDHLADADNEARYQRLEQIAYHYSRSGSPSKAAHFTRQAGDKARTRQADETALAFYAQTLAVPRIEGIAAEHGRAYAGIGDVYTLQGDCQAASASYQAALDGASTEDKHRLRAKLALLAPLVGQADPGALQEARQVLPTSDPVRPWLGAALVWLYAGGDRLKAITLCQDLLSTAREQLRVLLEEGLECLEGKKPLPPYADLIDLFASSCLRLTPGDGS